MFSDFAVCVLVVRKQKTAFKHKKEKFVENMR